MDLSSTSIEGGIDKMGCTERNLKVIVTVKSSECIQKGFGPLIIDYICNFFI